MSEEPRFAPNGNRLPERLPVGHRLVDTTKQQWIIGPSIGCGGFGDIYLTRRYDENKDDLKRLTQEQIIRESSKWTNVIKFEHFSGPLFAEINFYLRCAREETVEEYMTTKKLKHLGMPRFVASGIYDPLRSDNPPPVCKNTVSSSADKKPPAAKRPRITKVVEKKTNGVMANGKVKRIPASAQSKEKKYRFLVLQRFGEDLQKVWTRSHERFDMKTAFNIALKVIDTLEYIHSHGYVHADVKASNLLLEWQPKSGAKPDDHIYLVDFGLVERFYSKDGTHREHVEDQRRANNGTVEFSSRDAHIGAFSRRSDLESLAYNLLYWVSGGRLPWVNCLKDHSLVEASKKWYMDNLEVFVNYCFNEDAYPVDPVKLLRGIDPTTNGHSSARSSQSHHSNGRANGRSAHSTNNNNESTTTSATSTKASTVGTRTPKTPSSRSKISSALSTTSSSSTSSSSAQDSIMCAALYDFLSYIKNLSFEAEPDYHILKSILSNALGDNSATRAARTARKRSVKKVPPKRDINPTPAMREVLDRLLNKKAGTAK